METQRIILVLLVIAFAALLVIQVSSGWVKLRDGIFQEGYTEGLAAGKVQTTNAIFQELRTTGQLRLNYTFLAADGSTSTEVLILRPSQ